MQWVMREPTYPAPPSLQPHPILILSVSFRSLVSQISLSVSFIFYFFFIDDHFLLKAFTKIQHLCTIKMLENYNLFQYNKSKM